MLWKDIVLQGRSCGWAWWNFHSPNKETLGLFAFQWLWLHMIYGIHSAGVLPQVLCHHMGHLWFCVNSASCCLHLYLVGLCHQGCTYIWHPAQVRRKQNIYSERGHTLTAKADAGIFCLGGKGGKITTVAHHLHSSPYFLCLFHIIFAYFCMSFYVKFRLAVTACLASIAMWLTVPQFAKLVCIRYEVYADLQAPAAYLTLRNNGQFLHEVDAVYGTMQVCSISCPGIAVWLFP